MTAIIAMWSGPRNISTAMMRSFENRPDTTVWDEPYYAYYLNRTGIDHPMANAIINEYETDGERVSESLLKPPMMGESIHYQKHMTQHMVPGTPMRWVQQVKNAFLIREPYAVAASYAAKRRNITVEDLGFHRQLEIFHQVCDADNKVPPVLDAADVLANPKRMLVELCNQMDIAFCEEMLTWPKGRRSSDGIWGRHWYAAVEASSRFATQQKLSAPLAPELAEMADSCKACYEEMYNHRIKPAGTQ